MPPAVRPYLVRIQIYPIKSLDPLDLGAAEVVDGAGLRGDREFAFFESGDKVLNAKRARERLLSMRAIHGEAGKRVELCTSQGSSHFDLAGDRKPAETFVSEWLGRPVELRQDGVRGFPDDPEASGPTVVGTGSIELVAQWFDWDADEVRRRFRSNLEIAGLRPFEEDLLFGAPGEPRRFRIGAVELLGTNPCARCVVPSLDSRGRASADTHFAREFASLRKRHAPAGSRIHRYDHYYRFAVNTRLAPEQGEKELRAGDELELLD